MVNNPIYPGFLWRQAFDFPQGFFEQGDVVRAEFRRFAKDAHAVTTVKSDDGAVIEGDRLFVELNEGKTELIKAAGAYVITNFVVERAGKDIPIGVIVTVPVAVLPTRPK